MGTEWKLQPWKTVEIRRVIVGCMDTHRAHFANVDLQRCEKTKPAITENFPLNTHNCGAGVHHLGTVAGSPSITFARDGPPIFWMRTVFLLCTSDKLTSTAIAFDK
jgi:hypothetical protein